jgi:hypothetical protein
MVLAAPLFLIAQTKSLRQFYLENKPGFLLMGLSVGCAYLSLKLLGKIYETEKLSADLSDAKADLETMLKAAENPSLLAALLLASGNGTGSQPAASQGAIALQPAVAPAQATLSLRAALEESVRSERKRRAEERRLLAQAEAAVTTAKSLLNKRREEREKEEARLAAIGGEETAGQHKGETEEKEVAALALEIVKASAAETAAIAATATAKAEDTAPVVGQPVKPKRPGLIL